MKYLTDYIPATDTTEFENSMIAIIGDDASIPPVIVTGAKYYKCASVDTATQTWSGYELVLTGGVYSVSETLTTGLSYAGFTPLVGGVYNTDTSLMIRNYYNSSEDDVVIPVNGLVFYAPLSTASDTAVSGQSITTAGDGNISFVTHESVPACLLDGFSCFLCGDDGLPSGDSDRTFSIWLKALSNAKSYLASYGSEMNSYYFAPVLATENRVGFISWGNDPYSDIEVDVTKWVNYVITFSGGVLKMFIDGIQIHEANVWLNTGSSGTLAIGSRIGGGERFHGYLAGCRIYNRVLTQDEITALASEFTPTA